MRRLIALLPVLLLGVTGCSGEDAPEAAPTPASSSTSPTPSTEVAGVPTPESAWRTETYRDVQLDVPDTWKVGYAPIVSESIDSSGRPANCGVGVAGKVGNGRTSQPYVGRPGYGSDLCQILEPDQVEVGSEAMWFDSPLPVG